MAGVTGDSWTFDICTAELIVGEPAPQSVASVAVYHRPNTSRQRSY